MKHYVVKKIKNTPDWENIPTLKIDTPYCGTEGVSAGAQVCYGQDAFHLRLWADVPELRAEEQGRTGVPCSDSCLEFFFQPVPGDRRYINLEFNYNGCYFLGTGTCVKDLLRLLPEENWEDFFSANIQKTTDGWEICYQIPYDFIRQIFPDFAPRSGAVFRGNCYACSDLTQPPYYLSWSPVLESDFTFHRSECFGEFVFE